MAAETLIHKESDTGDSGHWSYGNEPIDRKKALEDLEFIVSLLEDGKELDPAWLIQAQRAYVFLMSSEEPSEMSEPERVLNANRLRKMGRALMGLTIGVGIAFTVSPRAAAEPLPDPKPPVTAVSPADRPKAEANLHRLEAAINALIDKGVPTDDYQIKVLEASRDSLLKGLFSDQDNNPLPGQTNTESSTEEQPQDQPTTTLIAGPEDSTPQGVAPTVPDLLGISDTPEAPSDDTTKSPETTDTMPRYKKQATIDNPYAALGQPSPAQITTQVQPLGETVFTVNPNTTATVDTSQIPTTDSPHPPIDTPGVGVEGVDSGINTATAQMIKALDEGDQSKFTTLANETVEDLGPVGSLLTIAETLDQMRTDKPTALGEVTPSPLIAKGALEKLYREVPNKAERNMIIRFVNTLIKFSLDSPAPRNSSNPPAGDADYVQAMKKRGVDSKQKGFGSWVNDCKEFIETAADISGFDKKFGVTKNGDHMDTAMLYRQVMRTHTAGGSTKYKILKLSELKNSDFRLGDIVLSEGRHVMAMVDFKAKNSKNYKIIDAARGSVRAPSPRPIDDLGYMRQDRHAIVMRLDWPSNDKSTVSYNKPIKSKKDKVRPLLDLIAKSESNGNYNAYWGNAKNTDVKLTDMTIDEVLKWQDEYVASGKPSSAAGRYQIIRNTLRALAKTLGMDKHEMKFSPETQDKMAIKLLEQRGLNKYLTGKISAKKFAHNISREWAAFPKATGDNPDASFYAGDGLNAGHVKVEKVLNTLEQIL